MFSHSILSFLINEIDLLIWKNNKVAILKLHLNYGLHFYGINNRVLNVQKPFS